MTRPATREQKLRLPPFAERVPADVRSVFISAGPAAWERAKRWRWDGQPGLVAPPDVNPATIDWPIAGKNVALIALDMPREPLIDLCDVLLRARPGVLAVLHGPTGSDRLDILAPNRDG